MHACIDRFGIKMREGARASQRSRFFKAIAGEFHSQAGRLSTFSSFVPGTNGRDISSHDRPCICPERAQIRPCRAEWPWARPIWWMRSPSLWRPGAPVLNTALPLSCSLPGPCHAVLMTVDEIRKGAEGEAGAGGVKLNGLGGLPIRDDGQGARGLSARAEVSVAPGDW